MKYLKLYLGPVKALKVLRDKINLNQDVLSREEASSCKKFKLEIVMLGSKASYNVNCNPKPSPWTDIGISRATFTADKMSSFTCFSTFHCIL